jgi:hypothetical protein
MIDMIELPTRLNIISEGLSSVKAETIIFKRADLEPLSVSNHFLRDTAHGTSIYGEQGDISTAEAPLFFLPFQFLKFRPHNAAAIAILRANARGNKQVAY